MDPDNAKFHSRSGSSSRPQRSQRRVVITGLGMINPLGSSLDDVWNALSQGRSGVHPIQLFDASVLPTTIAAEIPDFNGKAYMKTRDAKKALRVMARAIQMATAAAQLAIDDGNIDTEALDSTRFGVEFGAGLMATDLDELSSAASVSANCQPGVVDLGKWGTEGLSQIPPLWMLKYLPNMLACHVSILHDAQGPNNTITESEVASLLALGEAYRILVRDQADIFLVGGADSKLNPLSMVRQCLFGELSTRNDEPAKASRPFDRSRDGLVVGEGATVLALEDLEHAQKRGAKIYAEVVGFGAGFDRKRNGEGIARVIHSALQDANVKPDEIDHVNAHGMGTVAMDVWEAKGLRRAFGDTTPNIPVFAGKSYYGNMGAASGVTEMAASLLALDHGLLPRTLNYEEHDPECPISVNATERSIHKSHLLKIGFTDLGQCAAVVCRRWS